MASPAKNACNVASLFEYKQENLTYYDNNNIANY